MPEPTTKAGAKMLYEMGLDDPIVGKGRHDLAVKRIRAIEAEAVTAALDALAAEVAGLPCACSESYIEHAGALVRNHDADCPLAAVLAIIHADA